MKISTKGRYALRLMLDLATYNTGEPISLKDIAKDRKFLKNIWSRSYPFWERRALSAA